MTIFERYPPVTPTASLLWEALVLVEERQQLGAGPRGARAIVNINGGHFRGGPAMGASQADFVGDIPPGGADRQTVRPDGAKELDALYEMRVNDGAVITVRNRVIVDERRAVQRYAMSRIEVTAPEGRWGWLNRCLIIGTIRSARPENAAVIVRAWLVDDLE